VFFENVAISNTRKICNFYVVDETSQFCKTHPHFNEAGGLWGDLVGSLDRNHIFKCKPSLSDKEIKTLQVECVTLQDIIDKYQLNRIDVLHMDAEGHDEAILLSINFEKIKPKIIMFEHVHMSFEGYLACTNHLYSHGYSHIHTSERDTIVGNPWISHKSMS
jgi:FkbM family methyltransferase